MNQSTIDQNTLDELIEIMGDDMSMLIDSYVEDTRLKLEQLAEFDIKTQQQAIFRLAHSLKGASRNVGVAAFADACEQIENLARAEQLTQKQFDQIELVQLFEAAINEIKQQLDSPS